MNIREKWEDGWPLEIGDAKYNSSNTFFRERNNTLYAFGCSFTCPFYALDEGCPNYKVENHFIPRLAEELKLNHINKGYSGISNESILKSFYDTQHLFKKGDIILLQTTFGNRLVFHNSIKGKSIDLNGPSHQSGNTQITPEVYGKDFLELANKYLVLYNDSNKTCDTIYQAFPIISEWCDMKGIKIIFWALDDYNNSPHLFFPPNGKGWLNWIQTNCSLLKDEMDTKDLHLGLKGMDTMFDLFLPKLR